MKKLISRLFPTLYLKIAAAFALILMLLGSLQLYVYVNNWLGFLQESEQRANWGIAEQLARKASPYVDDLMQPEELDRLLSELLLPPARLDLYLLDAQGTIKFHQAMPPRIRRSTVSIDPIKRFIERKHVGSGAILGDDPKDPEEQTIFSAWPISLARAPGYVYVVLGANQYELILNAIGESYLLNATSIAALLSLLAAMAAGFLAFYYLTTPLKRLTGAVTAFQAGDFSTRIENRSGDELETLAATFNSMAATIEQKIGELKQQDNLRRELVANISHDLRSPLTAMRSSLDTIILQFDSLDRGQMRSFLQASMSSLDFLQNLVTELFELSKLEARIVEPAKEPFSMPDLCDDVISQLAPKAAAAQITLRLEAPEEMDFVYADIGMISKVLLNLVENAVRYSEAHGSVAVLINPEPEGVRTSVSDTGIGIPAEALPRIFDRFYRVDESRENRRGGTGLGLAIVKRILESHGTDIDVKSVVGEGTTFSFTLPYHR